MKEVCGANWVKSDLSFGIIDVVYPTTELHVGTLGQVVWIIFDKQLTTKNDGNELLSQSRNSMKIPEEPVVSIIIIGSLISFLE